MGLISDVARPQPKRTLNKIASPLSVPAANSPAEPVFGSRSRYCWESSRFSPLGASRSPGKTRSLPTNPRIWFVGCFSGKPATTAACGRLAHPDYPTS